VEDVPADMAEEIDSRRHDLIERVVEMDDELMARYLDGEEIAPAELRRALRLGVIANRIVPVLCGSALRNKGVQPLLDGVVDYLPSPLDIPPVHGLDPVTGDSLDRPADPAAPFAALAFKIVADPFVGKLAYIRVYSGTLPSGSYVYNSTKDSRERVGRMLQMHANHREDIPEVSAGDIAAIVGLKGTSTGDTLCDQNARVVLESIKFPEPVISVAIEPKTKADQDRMGNALGRLSEEDPTFRVRTDTETGQTLIDGMGELHLEVIVDRMMREFRVDANVGRPQVSYRETVTRPVKAEGRFIRQTGGRGQFGHVWLQVSPLDRGTGFEFVDKIVGGVVPREYIGAVEAGVKEAMVNGVVTGFPVVDIRVELVDGSYHEVDSSEMAFKIAGSMALKSAVQKGSPVVLQPIMKVEVTTPEEFMGDIMGDLNARRGQIQGMEMRANAQVIRALVPLGRMFGYATDVRSMSQGRATYSMEFSHYEPAPRDVEAELAKARS
jgi:elongation factor G